LNYNQLTYGLFFHQLEEKLGYEFSIEKYKLFCKAIEDYNVLEEQDLVQLCKMLFLKEARDEEKFGTAFYEFINAEAGAIVQVINTQVEIKQEEEQRQKSNQDGTPKEGQPKEKEVNEEEEFDEQSEDSEEENYNTGEEAGEEVVKYFHPKLEFESDPFAFDDEVDTQSEKYNLSNDYLPFSSRQLKKSWQYYRYKQKGGLTDQIDIPETIKEIAKEGFFLEPKYVFDRKNRKDTILILADVRGSMVSFHELIRELIRTAQEGGHNNVAVYYFSNIPGGSVFKSFNLSEPIRIEQVYAQCNPNFTKAIIISDAGASRFSNDEEAIVGRISNTKKFIKVLIGSVSKAIWLNPMPMHRWKGNAAEQIAEFVDMVPVMEEDERLFLNAFKALS